MKFHGLISLLLAELAWAVCNQSFVQKLNPLVSKGGSHFGFTVEISGEYMITGAPDNSNSKAHIFERDAGGVWNEVTVLGLGAADTPDVASADKFGWSVSIDADAPSFPPLVAVGAKHDDDAGFNAGSVYLYSRAAAGTAGGAWSLEAKLLQPASTSSTYYGTSVALSNGRLVVGAPRALAPASTTTSGAAYVYARDAAGGWALQQTLHSENPTTNDQFGTSVAIRGSLLAVGEIFGPQNSGGGAVWVFKFTGSTWDRTAMLAPADSPSSAQFGNAISIARLPPSPSNSPVIAVGAWKHNNLAPFMGDSGAAYIFTQSPTNESWSQAARLTDAAPDGFDQFGVDVALGDYGGSVLVGSFYDDAGLTQAGSTFVAEAAATAADLGEIRFDSWTPLGFGGPQLLPPDAKSGKRFGVAVARYGDTALVGAMEDDCCSMANVGAIYVFDLSCDADLTSPTPNPTAHPTAAPTGVSSTTASPTSTPTVTPTTATGAPSTANPSTANPSTANPSTANPSFNSQPTMGPSTANPTTTAQPTTATDAPTAQPSENPSSTMIPTLAPTNNPTVSPSPSPTRNPTHQPTIKPSSAPSASPSPSPTNLPTTSNPSSTTSTSPPPSADGQAIKEGKQGGGGAGDEDGGLVRTLAVVGGALCCCCSFMALLGLMYRERQKTARKMAELNGRAGKEGKREDVELGLAGAGTELGGGEGGDTLESSSTSSCSHPSRSNGGAATVDGEGTEGVMAKKVDDWSVEEESIERPSRQEEEEEQEEREEAEGPGSD